MNKITKYRIRTIIIILIMGAGSIYLYDGIIKHLKGITSIWLFFMCIGYIIVNVGRGFKPKEKKKNVEKVEK